MHVLWVMLERLMEEEVQTYLEPSSTQEITLGATTEGARTCEPTEIKASIG